MIASRLCIFACLLAMTCLLTSCGQPTFIVDPARQFHVEFGRGSGWHGLSMVIIDPGKVLLSREPTKSGDDWTKTELTLTAAQTKEIAALINRYQLTGLKKSYSANVMDGTQWAIHISQDGKESVTYFDNSFPDAIKKFATDLDAFLNRAGLATATWKPGGREIDGPLWKAVEGKN